MLGNDLRLLRLASSPVPIAARRTPERTLVVVRHGATLGEIAEHVPDVLTDAERLRIRSAYGWRTDRLDEPPVPAPRLSETWPEPPSSIAARLDDERAETVAIETFVVLADAGRLDVGDLGDEQPNAVDVRRTVDGSDERLVPSC